jgi:group I intron endonuclease
MYYTIYKITNTTNNKIYIGKHQTLNINDHYFGSGKAIKSAIKYHGKDKFIKEILFVFDNEIDMNSKEKELITEKFVNRADTYNMGIGGEGGAHFKGKTHSTDTKERIKTSVKINGSPPPGFKGGTHSEEARQKIAEAQRQRVGKKMWVTNGNENKFVDIAMVLPEGWTKGRFI